MCNNVKKFKYFRGCQRGAEQFLEKIETNIADPGENLLLRIFI